MLEISWSELLILAVVTLLFVGPKELPVFLRTIGRYAGMMRRQANEFKAHFDAAMREAELSQLKDEMNAMQASVNAEVMGAEKILKETGAMMPPELTGASSFTAAAHAAVFPQAAGVPPPAAQTPAPATPVDAAADPALPPPVQMGQVYVRPAPAEAAAEASPQSVPMPSPASEMASTAVGESEPPRPQVVKSES